MKPIGVDPECYELADHFLDGYDFTDGDEQSLAETIQKAIEDWFLGSPHLKENP